MAETPRFGAGGIWRPLKLWKTMPREREVWLKQGRIDTEVKYYPALYALLISVHNSIGKKLCFLKVSSDGHKENRINLQGRQRVAWRSSWFSVPEFETYYQKMTWVDARGMEWVIDFLMSVSLTTYMYLSGKRQQRVTSMNLRTPQSSSCDVWMHSVEIVTEEDSSRG